MHIHKLKPVFKDYLWGGNELVKMFGYPKQEILAEAWVLSCHFDGMCSIEDNNMPLIDLWKQNHDTPFPIMVKLIDAKQNLSIQVHPDDELGNLLEGENGKTEVWYIIDSQPGAYLYYGLNQDLTQEQFKQSIEDGTILNYLNKVEVKAGDVIFVPAKTIHAIGEGLIIAEIQQSSNLTYRLYDYQRKDIHGNQRELHIDKALQVTNLKKTIVDLKKEWIQNDQQAKIQLITDCKYFVTYHYQIKNPIKILLNHYQFMHVLVIEGEGIMNNHNDHIHFKAGDSFYITDDIEVNGQCQLIITYPK